MNAFFIILSSADLLLYIITITAISAAMAAKEKETRERVVEVLLNVNPPIRVIAV